MSHWQKYCSMPFVTYFICEWVKKKNWKYMYCLNPVQTSCFCHAELNSGIRCYKTWQKYGVWIKLLNSIQQAIWSDKLCSGIWLWHSSDSDVISLLCQTKFINYSNISCGIMLTWGNHKNNSSLCWGCFSKSCVLHDIPNIWIRVVHLLCYSWT